MLCWRAKHMRDGIVRLVGEGGEQHGVDDGENDQLGHREDREIARDAVFAHAFLYPGAWGTALIWINDA